MSTKPVVVVIGATGTQGGSVARSLLETGKYQVRALTRNAESAAAKNLASQGAQVVQGHLSNRDDIKRAFTGANIVFAVTSFWDPEVVGTDPTVEVRQGKLIADVAKETNVEWLLWSSLPDTLAESQGKLKHIVHFHGKNEVERYIRDQGIPATFVYMGFYMSNIGTFFPIVDNPNGTKSIAIPYATESTFIELTDPPKDTGPLVAALLEDKQTYLGKVVPVAGEKVTFGEMARVLTEVTGVSHTVRTLDDESVKEFPYINNNEVLEMCKWYVEYGYYGQTPARDISVAKKLHPKITSWRQFVEEKFGKK